MCKRSDTIANLAKALVGFNGEVKVIEKDSSNPHFKNRYASLDNIIDEIRPILTKHGLSVIQMPGGDGEKFTMTTMLLHESGEWIESDPIVMRPVKNDPQGIGSCATYARRYSLAAFLSLNTGEDDDGDAATHHHEPQRQAQGANAQAPSPNTNRPASQPTGQVGTSSNAISDAQKGLIARTKKERDMPDDAYRRILQGFNVESTTQLTKADASQVIKMLQEWTAPVAEEEPLPF